MSKPMNPRSPPPSAPLWKPSVMTYLTWPHTSPVCQVAFLMPSVLVRRLNMSYAVCIIISIIIARLFWRALLTIAAWCTMLLLCYGLLRAAPDLGLSSGWLMTSYGAGAVGFFVGALIALKPIIN